MKFIDYVYKNKEGIVLIDKLRNTIKDICLEHIEGENKQFTSEELDKICLVIECNVIKSFVLDETIKKDEMINTISLENAHLRIGIISGFFFMLKGDEQIKIESYSDVFSEIIYDLFSYVDEEDIDSCSDIVKRVYDTLLLIESGERDYSYFKYSYDEFQRCISDLYKYLLKDLLNF